MADEPTKRELKIGDEVIIGEQRGRVIANDDGTAEAEIEIAAKDLLGAADKINQAFDLLCRAAAFHKSNEIVGPDKYDDMSCRSCGEVEVRGIIAHAVDCEWIALRDEYKRLGVWPECE